MNRGNSSAGSFELSFSVDGMVEETKMISNLSAGESSIIDFDWLATSGNHDFSIDVDPLNLVEEISESNNRLIESREYCYQTTTSISDIIISSDTIVAGQTVEFIAKVIDNAKELTMVNLQFAGNTVPLTYQAASDSYRASGTVPEDSNLWNKILSLEVTAQSPDQLAGTQNAQIFVLANLPNLEVAQVVIDNPLAELASTITGKVFIRNTGHVQADNIAVKMTLAGSLVTSQTITTLLVGQNAEIPFSFVSDCGVQQLEVNIDDGNLIEELDETDNLVRQQINPCSYQKPIISDLSISPEELFVGGEFEVSFNLATQNGTDSVEIILDGVRKGLMLEPSGGLLSYSITADEGSGEQIVKVVVYGKNSLVAEAIGTITVKPLFLDYAIKSSSIEFLEQLIEGQNLTVTGSLINFGNAPMQAYDVAFYANSELVATKRFTTLNFSFDWTPTYENDLIKFVIDPDGELSESDITNNQYLQNVSIADNSVPVIESIAVEPNTPSRQEDFTLMVSASDNAGVDVVQLTWEGNNYKLAYDQSTNLFKTNINSENHGLISGTVLVEDINGFTSDQTMQVNIAPKPIDLQVDIFGLTVDQITRDVNSNTAAVDVIINNLGDINSGDFIVDLLRGTQSIATQTLSIEANSNSTIRFAWEKVCGIHEYTIQLDPQQMLVEPNRDNNSLSFTIKDCDEPVILPQFESVAFNPERPLAGEVLQVEATFVSAVGIDQVLAIYENDTIQLVSMSAGLYEGIIENVATPGVKEVILKAIDLDGHFNTFFLQGTVEKRLPDLTISSLNLAAIPIPAGTNESVTFEVINNGLAFAEDIDLEMRVDGKLIASHIIDQISVSEHVSVSLRLSHKVGIQNVEVVIDPNNLLEEQDELNNSIARTFEAFDLNAPQVLGITTPGSIEKGDAFVVTAIVTDNVAVKEVNVTYNDVAYTMLSTGTGTTYSVEIPEAIANANLIEVQATDESGLTGFGAITIDILEFLPDLEIDPTSFTYSTTSDDNKTSLSIEVINDGNEAVTDALLRLSIDDIPSDSIVLSLNSKQQQTWIVDAFSGFKTANVKIEADPSLLVEESDESNNVFEREISVVDVLPPTKPIILSDHTGWSANENFEIIWNLATDNSEVDYYEHRLNNEDWVNVEKDTVTTISLNKTGVYRLQVRAIDIFGNISESSYTSLRYDEDTPTISVLRELHTGRGWSSHNSPFLTWEAALDNGSGISHYYIRANDQDSILIEGLAYHPTIDESGIYSYQIKAVDNVGLESEWSSVKDVFIDLDLPDQLSVNSITHPDQTKWYNADSVVFNWNKPDDLSGISGYFYLLDKRPVTTLSENALQHADTLLTLNSMPYATEDLIRIPEGTWYFHVSAVDSVNLYDSLGGNYVINIDRTAPLTEINRLENDCQFTYELATSDRLSGVSAIYYKIDEREWQTGTSITISDPKSHNISYYAVDNAGNIEEAKILEVDYSPMSVELIVDQDICDTEYVNGIDLTVRGGVAPYRFAWSNGSAEQSLSDLQAGAYSVVVTDQLGCIISESAEIVQVDAPMISYDIAIDSTNSCLNKLLISVESDRDYQLFLQGETIQEGEIDSLCAGNYELKLTNDLGCEITENILIEEIPVEIKPFSILAFPNPSRDGVFNLNFEGNNDSKTTLKLYDLNGKLVKLIEIAEGQKTYQLEIDDNPSKLLFLKAETRSGIVKILKLVIY